MIFLPSTYLGFASVVRSVLGFSCLRRASFIDMLESSFLQLSIILRHFFFISFYQEAFKISKVSVLDHFLNNKKYFKKTNKYIQIAVCIQNP